MYLIQEPGTIGTTALNGFVLISGVTASRAVSLGHKWRFAEDNNYFCDKQSVALSSVILSEFECVLS